MWDFIFGTGTDLTMLQMAARSVVIFAWTLLMIRASGRRSFGQTSPFDACITVLLGAVLSRAVVGASPFGPTLISAATLVMLHRGVALACVRWSWFDHLISGRCRELMRNGQPDTEAMRKALITAQDLQTAIRQQLASEDVSQIDKILLERNGSISVVKKR